MFFSFSATVDEKEVSYVDFMVVTLTSRWRNILQTEQDKKNISDIFCTFSFCSASLLKPTVLEKLTFLSQDSVWYIM